MADTRFDTRKRFGLAQWERRVSPFLLVTATSFDKEEEELMRILDDEGCREDEEITPEMVDRLQELDILLSEKHGSEAELQHRA